MDLGATICTPKKPACVLCPWPGACAARQRGDPESFPVRAAKRRAPARRRGLCVTRTDGFVLVRSRPLQGLLGGMTEVPTSDWTHAFDEAQALAVAPRLARASPSGAAFPAPSPMCSRISGCELVVYTATVGAGTPAPGGMRWVALAELADEALPSVMRKVVAHAFQSAAGRIANGAASGFVDARKRPGGNVNIQRIDGNPRMSKVVVHGDTVYLAGLIADKALGQGVPSRPAKSSRSSTASWPRPAPTSPSSSPPRSGSPTFAPSTR